MKTILLVDDIELNRKFMIPSFDNDFFILEAGSGVDALTILKSNRVDLVITDIFMEPMDGYTLIREIRKRAKLMSIPIIAVTEKDEASQAEAIAAGADYFISRPMNSDELRKEAYRLTGQDSGRKELLHTDFLLQSIPGAVIVYKLTDENLEVLTCSRGISTITGWESEEICSNSVNAKIKKIHPADDEMFRNVIHKIITTKARAEAIYRGYKKDGSIVWLLFQGHYAGEEDGCPVIEGVILDVSNNSNMYQSILDMSTALITVVDAKTFEVLYANQAAKDTIKDNPEAYVGSVCYKHVFGLEKPCRHCIVNSTKKDVYHIPENKYGDHYYQQTFRKMNWHGKDAILEFTDDITYQKEKIDFAEKEKELQNSILDNIPAGIMVFKFIDDTIRIVSVNRSICEMMGMDRDKALGDASANITALTHPDDIHTVLDAAKRLSVAGACVEYEYRHFYRSRNDYVWVLGQGRSFKNADGYVYAYVNYTDITARKEVGELQNKLDKAAIQAATKAEFYSQMSHDMRTPMNIILGLAEIVLQEKDPSNLYHDVEKIKESGNYMLSLINDTLDLQKIEGGKLKLEPQIAECKAILEEVVAMMMPSAQNKKIALQVNGFENMTDECFVRADVFRLKQVMMNILSNSIKFTPAGGRIDVRVNDLGSDGIVCHRMLEITDTGIGMSQGFLENEIFKPFSQEVNNMSMTYPGSGLGLSIVKQLIDMMGGTIKVESKLGVGTSIYIYLDFELVSKEEVQLSASKKAEESKAVESNIEGKCILLCEDHPLNAEITIRLLQKVGCTVEWAKNGAAGVKLFDESVPGHFDAILMDIRMPVMDGLESARAIRAANHPDAKKVPIIAMSANAYDEDIKKSLEAGMNDHLAKPANPALLYETLGKYTNNA